MYQRNHRIIALPEISGIFQIAARGRGREEEVTALTALFVIAVMVLRCIV